MRFKDSFLRFCDDPELACCRAEKELEQLHTDNARLRIELQELAKAKAEGRISPVKCPCDASEEAQELMNAKADGRLVELPCNVGDSIWLAMCGQIREYIFMGITQQYGYLPSLYGRQRFGKYEDVGIALVDSIGKTVFLTREAAEKALAEVGGNDKS